MRERQQNPHPCQLQSVSPGEAEGLSIMRWQFAASQAPLRCLCKEAGDKEKWIGQSGGEEHHGAVGGGGGAEGPTFTVVRPSNVKDLICPFSRKTFSTLGMRRRASFFNMSWHAGPATGEARRMGGTERRREGGEREGVSVMERLRHPLGFCAERHISLEDPVSLLSH